MMKEKRRNDPRKALGSRGALSWVLFQNKNVSSASLKPNIASLWRRDDSYREEEQAEDYQSGEFSSRIVASDFGGNNLNESTSSETEQELKGSTNNSLKGKERKKVKRRQRLIKLCSGGSSKWRTRRKSIEQCSLLKSSVFASCRKRLDIRRYFRWCVEDACACPESGRCYCESLMAYAKSCEKENIFINWREHSHCQEEVTCPVKGAVFSVCATACPKTCENMRKFNETCSESCLPGCHCPANLVLHETKCILAEDCPAKLTSN